VGVRQLPGPSPAHPVPPRMGQAPRLGTGSRAGTSTVFGCPFGPGRIWGHPSASPPRIAFGTPHRQAAPWCRGAGGCRAPTSWPAPAPRIRGPVNKSPAMRGRRKWAGRGQGRGVDPGGMPVPRPGAARSSQDRNPARTDTCSSMDTGPSSATAGWGPRDRARGDGSPPPAFWPPDSSCGSALPQVTARRATAPPRPSRRLKWTISVSAVRFGKFGPGLAGKAADPLWTSIGLLDGPRRTPPERGDPSDSYGSW